MNNEIFVCYRFRSKTLLHESTENCLVAVLIFYFPSFLTCNCINIINISIDFGIYYQNNCLNTLGILSVTELSDKTINIYAKNK